ncbi:glycoside hydrolase family 16 protein [Tortispora caseinolytica NRRL Y-17796]|uniref:Glycoside hydrolase family 16 protein n=1 Tax=Tortispora caseinolytica NRRL Y-17796 TaxID=767744 RepID=A0A1E4TJF7_9ASCO|nr:glycoside hydrolase family 16 protein [Tortispora caseinolytica NRRL Y-17796]
MHRPIKFSHKDTGSSQSSLSHEDFAEPHAISSNTPSEATTSRSAKPYIPISSNSRHSVIKHANTSRNSAQPLSSSPPNGSEFDRYPQRVSSSTSINAPLLCSDRSTLSEDPPENPFVTDADFSPFGGYPASSFPLHIDDKEIDDYLHNPDPIQDAKYDRTCHQLDKRGASNLAGLAFLVLGAVGIFIILPVFTFSGIAHRATTHYEILSDYTYPMLSAIRTSLVDPDTPDQFKYKYSSVTGKNYTLVFSDEFNLNGRTFYPNEDQFWEGVDLNYAATNDIEWYDPAALSTSDGTLNIRLDAIKNHDLFYRSGMLQSWNKLCFKSGFVEISASLAGPAGKAGLWPGAWTMGNLGRPGYLSTTEGVWPYGYDECDAGITYNQSQSDGLSYLPGQKLNKCTCSGEDHPNAGTGRGAPEIDILEGSADGDAELGVVTQSYQIAPFDIWWRPNYDFLAINNYSVTQMNSYCGGPFQEAISGVTFLNNSWYDGDVYQMYGFEYEPGTASGFIQWYVADEPTLYMDGRSLNANGNVGRRQISFEPMTIILNLGMSNSWSYIDWPSLVFPTIMRVDYVRIYQDTSDPNSQITCDPPGYPTVDYIANHPAAYKNVNATSWSMAGYSFPKNKLTGC